MPNSKFVTRQTPPPAPDMPPARPFDSKAFRDALGCFPTGVALITTLDSQGNPVGLTCNSFSSVSLDPPLVSWGLRLKSTNLEAFRQAQAFAINVLAEDQKELSARFASSSLSASAKFEGIAWTPRHAGVPVIDDCGVSFECDKFAQHMAGDHILFLGQVVHFEHGRREDSLVFYKGAYMMLTRSLHELAVSGQVDPAELHQARRLVNCMLLRLACANGREEDFAVIERSILDIERHLDPAHHARRAEASLEFFRLITRAAHNEVLVMVSESLTTILRHVMKAAGSSLKFHPELVQARRLILTHLRARDADKAEQEMNAYFERIRMDSNSSLGS
ncbi:MAG: flavin reductase [Variovorax paradoxus]|nr:MAG: flavin reductase [Variovorax paradoxus]PZP99627.1 MAG: flavin reductase [Variovorax paradoxus]